MESEFSPAVLSQKITAFIENKTRIDEMEKNLAPLRTEKVADRIADLCFELMDKGE